MDRRLTRKRRSPITQADKNAKRREMYDNMSMAKKNALLLQRSLNKKEATSKRLLESINNENSIEPTFLVQGNLAIGAPSSVSETVITECEAFPCLNVLDKGKNIVHPFCIFEKGSTSGTSNDSYIPAIETTITDE